MVKGGLFGGVTVKAVGKDVAHVGEGLTSFHISPTIPDKVILVLGTLSIVTLLESARFSQVIPGWGNPVASDRNTIGTARALRDILGPVLVAKNEERRQQRATSQGA